MNMKEKKSEILGALFLNLKWNFLFGIYDPIYKRSYHSLMRVFLNHIKV